MNTVREIALGVGAMGGVGKGGGLALALGGGLLNDSPPPQGKRPAPSPPSHPHCPYP